MNMRMNINRRKIEIEAFFRSLPNLVTPIIEQEEIEPTTPSKLTSIGGFESFMKRVAIVRKKYESEEILDHHSHNTIKRIHYHKK